MKDSMSRLETEADHFKEHFEDALDKSSYNGGHTEDTLNRWADMLESEIDGMKDTYKSNDNNSYIHHFENAMIVGSAIDRAMLRKDFAVNAEGDWRKLREDLNHIATQLHRPVLPNVTVINIFPAAINVLDKVEVKQALEKLESSTDRFRDKFKNDVQHSTANMTERERVWDRWADYLEGTTDDLLDEFKDRDPKEFQKELERTMMVSEAINRIMLRSDLKRDTEMEWQNVRSQLNTVALAFGYPVVTNLISSR